MLRIFRLKAEATWFLGVRSFRLQISWACAFRRKDVQAEDSEPYKAPAAVLNASSACRSFATIVPKVS